MSPPPPLDNPFSLHNHSTHHQIDTVFYTIHPDCTTTPTSLHSLHTQILSTITPFTTSHIWQHQPFTLSLSLYPPRPHFHGRLRYGDNLDDEWFTVFLLFHISRTFPDLTVKVWDSDGDFLLIEAAFYLPKWITPENSENRVFVRNGEVHIIGNKLFVENPSLEEALRVLIESSEVTKASDEVQFAILRRVEEFPEKVHKNVHCVRVRVPLSVAQVQIIYRFYIVLVSFLVYGKYCALFKFSTPSVLSE